MGFLKLTNRKGKVTNKSLHDLFIDIDSIKIKSDGVYENKALSNNIVLKIDNPENIQVFKNLISVKEPSEEFQCMCLGDYAIELLQQNEIKTTIGFHHGTSIRLNQWTSDAELKYPDELLKFFFNLGLKEPLEQKKSDIERAKKSEQESNDWLKNSPKSYSKYWGQINDFDDSYIPKLLTDLKKEYKNQNDLILALLKSFGTSQNLWSGFPMYETISQTLLNKFKLEEIILIFLNSNKELAISIGLGRYLFSWDFRKELKKHKNKLSVELIEILRNAFIETNDAKGLQSVEKIKNYS